MPELPDVSVFKDYLDATSLHQTIRSVDVRERRILADVSPQKLRSRLAGDTIVSSRRHGKHLFAVLGNGGSLAFHFGMTGDLDYFKDEEDKPEYAQLVLTFDNGFHLSYNSRRKLGEIRVADDVDQFISKEKLGPDALECDYRTFKEALDTRKTVKSALMDQHLIAGIGNVYSDEILFQAGVNPAKQANQLDKKAARRLFRTMNRVLKTVIRHKADPDKLPRTYLTRNRKEGDKCPKCGGPLKTLQAGGRRGFYCPKCQK